LDQTNSGNSVSSTQDSGVSARVESLHNRRLQRISGRNTGGFDFTFLCVLPVIIAGQDFVVAQVIAVVQLESGVTERPTYTLIGERRTYTANNHRLGILAGDNKSSDSNAVIGKHIRPG